MGSRKQRRLGRTTPLGRTWTSKVSRPPANIGRPPAARPVTVTNSRGRASRDTFLVSALEEAALKSAAEAHLAEVERLGIAEEMALGRVER